MWKAALNEALDTEYRERMGHSVSPEILAALDRGLLILTVSDRAARSVRHAWDRLQVQRGCQFWESANVLSWRGWTHLIWKSMLLDGRATALLLSPFQEQHVWERVIRAGFPPRRPERTVSLAKLAAVTWQRLCAYEGGRRLAGAMSSLQGDLLQFATWARAFEHTCAHESLLSEALLEAELQRTLQASDLDRWRHGILLLGFDRPTPAQNALIGRCLALECTIQAAPMPAPGVGALVAAPDEREELRGCARWIRDRLDETPLARIALIVGDLEREMDTIDAVLREQLSPELEHIAADTSTAPYEFSLGRALYQEPMVRCALDLVQWALRPLEIEEVSRLLLCPYFAGNAEEINVRAEFDSSGLRRELRLRPEITIKSLLRELHKSSVVQSRLPLFSHVVERMAQAQSRIALHPRGFGDWVEWIRAWLLQARWDAPDSGMSSREYQIRKRWEDALDNLASLDFLGEPVTIQDALATLDRMVRHLIFAPASRDAPVQVIGPLEAAGEHFDLIWVLRAGEFDWPPGSASLPLLPQGLQHDLEMPGTDASQERKAAVDLVHRLVESCAKIVFSYATVTTEGAHQCPAAVVRDRGYDHVTLADFVVPEKRREPVRLEHLLDEDIIPPLPTTVCRGGVRALQLQAACGFRAFAELRLGSSSLRERDAGLNAMERGSMVHSALEMFWSLVKGQHELLAMEPSERDETVARAIVHALAEADRKRVDHWDSTYLDVQRIRLTKLLNDWLLLEMRRPDFTVVAQEKQQSVSVGPLQLSIRVDRVDSVEGRQVIIDYKTGEAKPSEWLGDRPDQPQLPLYAVISGRAESPLKNLRAPLGAIGFAQVRAGKHSRLNGFESAPGLLLRPDSHGKTVRMDAETFEQQIVRWQEVLERLAGEFAEGDTRVRPKRYPGTCEHCGQRVLCRVDAALFETDFEDELEGEDE